MESLLWFLTATVSGVAVLRSKRLLLLAEKTLSRLPLLNRLAPHIEAFHGASNELLVARPLVVGTAISLCSWGLEILAVYLCVVAMGAAAHFLVVAFIFAVVSLGGALTMLPGGVGAAKLGIAGTFASIVTSPGALSGFNIRDPTYDCLVRDPHRRPGPPLHTPLVGRTAYPLRKGTGW